MTEIKPRTGNGILLSENISVDPIRQGLAVMKRTERPSRDRMEKRIQESGARIQDSLRKICAGIKASKRL
jgi:hypothetical protein